MEMTRRNALLALAAGGSAALIASRGAALADDTAPGTTRDGPSVAPGRHSLVPLPFDPKVLNGISEKLITSHHENNYGTAIKNLNKVEEELANVTKETPGFVIFGLKERELTYTNSGILHELYFGNLGGDGKAAGAVQKALSDAFGGFGRWEEAFRGVGMSLAGGSGWAILDFNFHSGDLRTYWSSNHTQSLAFGEPLLVMDMYEHAYQMDYGAAAAKYVDAFFVNIQWDKVNQRYERARKAWEAIRG
jgi:superoxide dismutase, Fe-Mn family